MSNTRVEFGRGFELRQRKFEIIYSMKNADYTELKKSEKFTPALYHEKDGIWEGGSTSQFSPVMTFKLWEKFSDSCLEVSESMEVIRFDLLNIPNYFVFKIIFVIA